MKILKFSKVKIRQIDFLLLSTNLSRWGVILTGLVLTIGWVFNRVEITKLGLWILVLIPLFRIFILFFDFLIKKEKLMVLFSILVIFMLLLSFKMGTH